MELSSIGDFSSATPVLVLLRFLPLCTSVPTAERRSTVGGRFLRPQPRLPWTLRSSMSATVPSLPTGRCGEGLVRTPYEANRTLAVVVRRLELGGEA
jgi:hypothetical protein